MSGADSVVVMQGDKTVEKISRDQSAASNLGDVILKDPDLMPPPSPAATSLDQLPVLDAEGNPAKRYQLPLDFPENARPVGDGSYILKLDFPVTLRFKDSDGAIKEEVYKELHLKRLTGAKQKEIQLAKPEDLRAQSLASSSGISLGRAMLLMDRMDSSEIAAVLIIIRFFTTPGRKIGPSSSPL